MDLKKIVVLAIAAAFAAPLAAQSGGGVDRSGAGASATGGFAAMDRNNDGYISRDEARDATWANRFTELDKDNDGRLSASEFDALGKDMSSSTGASTSGGSTTGGMGGSVGPGGTQSGSSTSGIGDKPGQKQ